MKYIRIVRSFHLSIGLILSIFLLLEAVTGLILSEPGLIGANKALPEQNENLVLDNNQSLYKVKSADLKDSNTINVEKEVPGNVSALVLIKQLHQGIVNSWYFRWVIDIVAVSMILLTITGIYLSIPVLKAKRASKRISQLSISHSQEFSEKA